jgi:hypothetical protein
MNLSSETAPLELQYNSLRQWNEILNTKRTFTRLSLWARLLYLTCCSELKPKINVFSKECTRPLPAARDGLPSAILFARLYTSLATADIWFVHVTLFELKTRYWNQLLHLTQTVNVFLMERTITVIKEAEPLFVCYRIVELVKQATWQGLRVSLWSELTSFAQHSHPFGAK